MLGRNLCRRGIRRGLGAVQAALVLALIAVVVYIGIQSMSGGTNTELNQTAEGLADPAKLVEQFGP